MVNTVQVVLNDVELRKAGSGAMVYVPASYFKHGLLDRQTKYVVKLITAPIPSISHAEVGAQAPTIPANVVEEQQ